MSEDSEVARALGELQGTVRALQDQWARQENAASEKRHDLREKMERLAETLTKLEQQVERLSEKFAEVLPVVRNFQVRQHRTDGAKWALGIVWGAFLGGVAAIAYVIHDWVGVIIGLLWPPKH